ncbi:hypothetical protein M1555_05215 [Patescibacteria group bacterium]|nr:hypothetical protein [Patescibacteria group bacterium]
MEIDRNYFFETMRHEDIVWPRAFRWEVDGAVLEITWMDQNNDEIARRFDGYTGDSLKASVKRRAYQIASLAEEEGIGFDELTDLDIVRYLAGISNTEHMRRLENEGYDKGTD